MFLVRDRGILIFCGSDPRLDGYEGPVETVVFEEEHTSSLWRRGEIPEEPIRVLGVNPFNPQHYRYFLNIDNLTEDEYIPVASAEPPLVVYTWAEYLTTKTAR